MKQKSVQISEDCHEHLKRISDRLGLPIGKVAEKSILYISKKHIDPTNLKEGNPIGEIRKYHDHTISYITTFEKTKLQPLLDNLLIVYGSLQKAIDTLTKTEISSKPTGAPSSDIEEIKRVLRELEKKLMAQPNSNERPEDYHFFKNQLIENNAKINEFVMMLSKQMDSLCKAPLVSSFNVKTVKDNFIAHIKPLINYELKDNR